MATRLSQLAASLLLALTLAGCSSGTSNDEVRAPTNADALRDVANMIRDYTAANNRPPARAADLARFRNVYHVGLQAIESGDVVVLWGASVAGEGGGGGEAIIAYEKAAPDSGGSVLLENGTVKQMTAAEFNAAPKAGKK
jgi:hypothetical protein